MSPSDELHEPFELPELHEALLDKVWLARLEEDLATVASVEQVLPRPNVRTLVPPAPITVRDAFARLRSGELSGFQVRYHHAGEAWCDTLLARPDGVKLVRMRQ